MSKSSKTQNPQNTEDKNMNKETQWEEVATTTGIVQAQIIVGRLQTEGIPARAWQQSIGQSTGLIIGSLGMGHVLVPEEYAEQALNILEDIDDSYTEEE